MRRSSKTLKRLSNNWLSKLSSEEIEQEELIQAWKDPNMEGYQGMAAFRVLLRTQCKEDTIQDNTEPLKKSTPDKRAGVPSLETVVYDYMLGVPEEQRGLYCLIVQPLLQAMYYGVEIQTLDRHSAHLGVSKSGLGRVLKAFRDRQA